MPRFGPPARRTTRFGRVNLHQIGMGRTETGQALGYHVLDAIDELLDSRHSWSCHEQISFRSSGVGVDSFGHCHTGNFSRAVVADEFVQERSTQSAQDRTHQIDGELTEMLGKLGVANQALHQQRTNLARWIERRAGDRTDQDDDPVDDETDDDASEARGRAPVDRGAEHGEDEDRRADGFSRDGDQHPAGGGVVANGAQAEGGGVVADEDKRA